MKLLDKNHFITGEVEGSFEELWSIINILRAECPWDRTQTVESVKFKIVEEAYEVLECIDSGDFSALKNELGDVILVSLFIIKILEQEGELSLKDVFLSLISKLISRHPHIFGDKKLSTPEEVLRNWERMKRSESAGKGSGKDLKISMPSLYFAYRFFEKKINAGDIKNSVDKSDISVKLKKMIDDLLQDEDKEKIKNSVREILFTLAFISALHNVNPEEELRKKMKDYIQGEEGEK